jgi:hypothetical protein
VGIPLQVTAAPFAAGRDGDPVVLVVVATEQPAPAAPTTETFDLLVAPFSPGGDSRAGVRQTARMSLRPGANSVARYEVVSRLVLKPGRYSLRIGATRKSDGRTGSVYCDVDVPDFRSQDLSLSGLVLEAVPGVASAPKGGLADLLPIVPTTMREFAGDTAVTAFLRAYQGGARAVVPVQMTARITDARDATVWAVKAPLPPADRSSRAADCRLELPMAGLSPGPYLLTVEVAAGARTVRRDLRFSVRSH